MNLSKLSTAAIFAALMAVPHVASAITDGEILKIVHTANEAEIDAGKYAQSKADRDDVKQFAQTMVDDHKSNLKDEKQVCKNSDLKPQKNEAAKQLEEESKNSLSDLKQKKGMDLDRAYISNQVAAHQKLLDDLNQTYIPAAQNANLKSYLQETATHVREHLAKARDIQVHLQ